MYDIDQSLDYVTSVDLWSDINYHGISTPTHPSPVNPHMNMRGPRGPRKTLKAAQTVIIGISEPMW